MENELAPSIKRWLSRMAPGSIRNYKENLEKFLSWLKENGDEFSDMGPDELVSFMQDATGKEQFIFLDKVQEHVSSLKGLRFKTLQARYTAIRSFFIHNRAALPKDPTFTIRADVPPVKGTLTLENVRDIILISTPAYRFTFLSMLQAGMGLEEFVYWNLNGWDSLQKDLKERKSFITIDLPGRKKMKNVKPYSTFLLNEGDAKAALSEYLPYRQQAREKFDRTQKIRKIRAEERGEKYVERKFDPNVIVYNTWGCPLVKDVIYDYWFRKCVKLKILKQIGDSNPRNRYGKNPHEMRDLFRSQWEKTSAKESVGEYLMGHQIDPLEYNKAYRDIPWVLRELRKALPMLNIMSSTLPFGLVSKDEYESALYDTQEELRKSKEEIESLSKGQNSADSNISEMRTELNRMKEELAKMKKEPQNLD